MGIKFLMTKDGLDKFKIEFNSFFITTIILCQYLNKLNIMNEFEVQIAECLLLDML